MRTMNVLTRWSEYEISYLKNQYPHASKEKILKKTHRNWRAIRRKAKKLGIRRLCGRHANNYSWKKNDPRITGENNPNYGGLSKVQRTKLSLKMTQKWRDSKYRKRMIRSFKKDTIEEKALRFSTHEKLVQDEIQELQKQGFRCIEVTQSAVKPDIIAIEGNCKIYAVEVTQKEYPNYHKYENMSDSFDDIIWIVRGNRVKRK